MPCLGAEGVYNRLLTVIPLRVDGTLHRTNMSATNLNSHTYPTLSCSPFPVCRERWRQKNGVFDDRTSTRLPPPCFQRACVSATDAD